MKKIISTIFILVLFISSFTFLSKKVSAQTIGDVLTGHYTYSDPEGDLEGQSLYQWYRETTPIQGATNLTYTVTSNDVGHTLYFQVTPVALTGISPGAPIMSAGINIVAPSVSGGGSGSSGGGVLPVVSAGTSTPVITFANSTTSTTTLISTITNNGSIISTIARTLKYKMTGNDVKALQVYLNTHGYIVSKSGAGSIGHETTSFGAATRSAVIALQKANHITPVSGIVGPLTRAVINK